MPVGIYYMHKWVCSMVIHTSIHVCMYTRGMLAGAYTRVSWQVPDAVRRPSEWIVFEGISVDETGKQHYLDASVAYKRAVLIHHIIYTYA